MVSSQPALASVFGSIEGDLASVEKKIQKALQHEDKLLSSVATHLQKAGGKRMRPALVLLCGRIWGEPPPVLTELAAAVEIIHMATLVHDDVIDDADIRRGWPTVNSQWNSELSILTGDFLFATAFCLLANSGDNRLVRLMAEVVYEMSAGEITQLASTGVLEQDEAEYFDRIEKKTSIFIASCCELGGLAAGGSQKEAQVLRAFGHGIGMGFQIVDDVLDFTASPQRLGKPVGNDLTSGVITLPVIHALQSPAHGGRLAELIADGVKPEQVGEVVAVLEEAGSFTYALAKAAAFVSDAKRQLLFLPPSRARQSLEEMADFIVHRDH